MTPRLLKTESLAPVTIGRAALHELAVAYALEQFDLKGQCMPTFIVAAGYRVVWIEADMEDRDRLAAGMRAMMALLGAHAYSFITEAWVAALHSLKENDTRFEEMLAFANKHGVKALPKHMRDDVMMVTTFDRAGGVNESRWLVTERRHGPNFLGPRMETDEGWDTAEGRFWNLLDGL